MLVMILEKLPKKWRGVLSRWLIEVRPGMFLGNPSQRVRDELWRQITERPAQGYVLQLWSSRHPQGYDYRQHGNSKRMLTDFEGLGLLTIRKQTRKNRKAAWLGNQNSS
jgi:CRISPR-associated protein Cas2